MIILRWWGLWKGRCHWKSGCWIASVSDNIFQNAGCMPTLSYITRLFQNKPSQTIVPGHLRALICYNLLSVLTNLSSCPFELLDCCATPHAISRTGVIIRRYRCRGFLVQRSRRGNRRQGSSLTLFTQIALGGRVRREHLSQLVIWVIRRCLVVTWVAFMLLRLWLQILLRLQRNLGSRRVIAILMGLYISTFIVATLDRFSFLDKWFEHFSIYLFWFYIDWGSVLVRDDKCCVKLKNDYDYYLLLLAFSWSRIYID